MSVSVLYELRKITTSILACESFLLYRLACFQIELKTVPLGVDDINIEHERLVKSGVVFRTEPTDAGGVTIAVFDDTCGNLIQLYQAP